MKLSFSWVGLVVFALPMLINIAYVVFPPAGAPASPKKVTRWVEAVEKISRIAYFLLLTFLVREGAADWKSTWLLLAVFPVLYYLFAAVWMGNVPAAVMMVIFGAAHITLSALSF